MAVSAPVIRDIRRIPVIVYVDDQFVCRGLCRVLINEFDEMQEQLVLPAGHELRDVEPDRVMCQMVRPMDAFSYLGTVSPDSIGRDE